MKYSRAWVDSENVLSQGNHTEAYNFIKKSVKDKKIDDKIKQNNFSLDLVIASSVRDYCKATGLSKESVNDYATQKYGEPTSDESFSNLKQAIMTSRTGDFKLIEDYLGLSKNNGTDSTIAGIFKVNCMFKFNDLGTSWAYSVFDSMTQKATGIITYMSELKQIIEESEKNTKVTQEQLTTYQQEYQQGLHLAQLMYELVTDTYRQFTWTSKVTGKVQDSIRKLFKSTTDQERATNIVDQYDIFYDAYSKLCNKPNDNIILKPIMDEEKEEPQLSAGEEIDQEQISIVQLIPAPAQ